MLQKDPGDRISLDDVPVHPWVTGGGSLPVLQTSHERAVQRVFETMRKRNGAAARDARRAAAARLGAWPYVPCQQCRARRGSSSSSHLHACVRSGRSSAERGTPVACSAAHGLGLLPGQDPRLHRARGPGPLTRMTRNSQPCPRVPSPVNPIQYVCHVTAKPRVPSPAESGGKREPTTVPLAAPPEPLDMRKLVPDAETRTYKDGEVIIE
jgi:hypothetical protein